MKIHPSITLERIGKAREAQFTTLANPGFCIACGADADGCEPDARNYECEECGKLKVFGAQELAILIMF